MASKHPKSKDTKWALNKLAIPVGLSILEVVDLSSLEAVDPSSLEVMSIYMLREMANLKFSVEQLSVLKEMAL